MRPARRGLSPIVSVILLILVAVGATVILYSWLSGAASNNPTQTSSLYERIRIDTVSYNGTTVFIYVSNLGKTNVKITTAYVINATSGQVLCTNTSVNTAINAGGTGTVLVGTKTNACDLGTGVYIARVTTSNGVEATYTFSV